MKKIIFAIIAIFLLSACSIKEETFIEKDSVKEDSIEIVVDTTYNDTIINIEI